jgi:hypothetical protein
MIIMALELVRAVAMAENSDDFHLGRLLLLMLAIDGNNSQSVDGITKLAKLDFLLRYPNCLERALFAVNRSVEEADIQAYERTTIESKMIRFKYGPWDNRYRRWIGLLVARGLIKVELDKRTVKLSLTEMGKDTAVIFSQDPAYGDIKLRSQIVKDAFGKMTSSRIKEFIYKTFPELANMKWGEEISI